MTTHAQPIGATPDRSNGPNSHVSAARLTMIGGIAAASIAAVPAVIVALNSNDPGATSPTGSVSQPTTVTPTVVAKSPLGSIDQVTIDGSNVAVAGSATENVESVVVTIGPRRSGGQYWAARADVQDLQWKLVVETDSERPADFQTTVFYKERTAGQRFTGLTFQTEPSTPAPPPPGDDVTCAVERGDACFTGPRWGPPSVYRSGQ
jgi:hypothetical protein